VRHESKFWLPFQTTAAPGNQRRNGGQDQITATYGGDTITGGGGADFIDVLGHRSVDVFAYLSVSDSLDAPGKCDTIEGFSASSSHGGVNDVTDFSAISGVSAIQGALANSSQKVAVDSLAWWLYNAQTNQTLLYANATGGALS